MAVYPIDARYIVEDKATQIIREAVLGARLPEARPTGAADEFDKLTPDAQESVERAGTVTVEEARSLGISADEAFKIRDAYRAVLNDSIKGANNPTGLGREILMNRIGELLSQ